MSINKLIASFLSLADNTLLVQTFGYRQKLVRKMQMLGRPIRCHKTSLWLKFSEKMNELSI